MKRGIFGGSFDPVHNGHLLLAERCREACQLDLVQFIPAAQPPHKPDRELLSGKHRMEMLQLAIAGNEAFQVTNLELERGGTSFTVETLQTLKSENPEDELFFLMGADSLDEFRSWKEPQEICRLAIPIVVSRIGSGSPELSKLAPFCDQDRLDQIEEYRVDFPNVEISSTEIRTRVEQNRSIRYQTPRAVEAYIQQHRLYR